MSELKACQFCGKNVAVIDTCKDNEICGSYDRCDIPGYYLVVCDFTKGGCGASTGYRPTKEGAIAAWNTRAEPEPRALTLEELREMGGKPVYVVPLDGEKPRWYQLSRNKQFVKDFNQCKRLLSYYGKTWLAFDRQPEGE